MAARVRKPGTTETERTSKLRCCLRYDIMTVNFCKVNKFNVFIFNVLYIRVIYKFYFWYFLLI